MHTPSGVLIALTSLVAYHYLALFFDRPGLPEAERLAYTARICELQQELGHPVCQTGDGQYGFDTDWDALIRESGG